MLMLMLMQSRRRCRSRSLCVSSFQALHLSVRGCGLSCVHGTLDLRRCKGAEVKDVVISVSRIGASSIAS